MMTTSPQETWLVLGAGPLGRGVAMRGVARGHHVRLATRSGFDPGIAGIEAVACDVCDPAQRVALGTDTAAVFHCLNVPYPQWPVRLPILTDAALALARQCKARLVIADNLYMYAQDRGPITEDTPTTPPTRKGALRQALAQQALAAHHAGDVRVVFARGSDYFGPGVPSDHAHMGAQVFAAVRAGRRAMMLGNPDRIHSFTYVPDFVAALATLATAPDDALGRAWIVPTQPAMTRAAVIARAAALAGTQPKILALPTWAIGVMGLVHPLMGEMREMMVQFDRDFAVDSSAYEERFGVKPTPLDDALRATLDAADRSAKAQAAA